MYTLEPVNTRYSGRISFGLLAWMVVSAVIAASAGVSYAVLKNNQVAEHTELAKINRSLPTQHKPVPRQDRYSD